MELIKREMPADYEIYDTGDWHIGVACTNEDGIFEMIEDIASEDYRYIIIKGDLIDAIATTDKRFSLTSFEGNTVTTPHEQANRILEILRPIQDRILFIQLGNHEYKLLPVFNCLDHWCDNLNAEWGGYDAKFIHLKGGNPQWKGFYTHGNGTIRSAAKDPIQAKANMHANLKNKLKKKFSDCIYHSMGHAHQMLLVEPTIQDTLHLIDDGEKIQQTYIVDVDQAAQNIDVEARWYACNGSFLGTMSQPGKKVIPYSEIAMYDPVEQGYIKQTINGHKMVKAERVVV